VAPNPPSELLALGNGELESIFDVSLVPENTKREEEAEEVADVLVVLPSMEFNTGGAVGCNWEACVAGKAPNWIKAGLLLAPESGLEAPENTKGEGVLPLRPEAEEAKVEL
jgi:hypothetical protein